VAGVTYFIASHRNPDQVVRLVGTLHDTMREADRIVVHHDPRGSPLDCARLAAYDRVETMPAREVDWGDMSQVDLALSAVDWIVGRHDPDWMVYLSGQDYPLRPAWLIAEHLDAADLDAFIDAQPVEAVRWQLGRGRYLYRYPGWARAPLPGWLSRLLAARNAWLTTRPGVPYLNLWRADDQLHVGVRRNPFSAEFRCWKGSQWWTLSRRALRYLLQYVSDHPEYRDHFLAVAFAADEAFINTVLANAMTLRVQIHDNRRYLYFDDPVAGHPMTLTREHAQRALCSGKDFVRKLDVDVDEHLLDMLDARIREPFGDRLAAPQTLAEGTPP
jgi:hypothetical protein